MHIRGRALIRDFTVSTKQEWTKKEENTSFWCQRGGANYRVKMVILFFNFESARGAKYREYGIRYYFKYSEGALKKRGKAF